MNVSLGLARKHHHRTHSALKVSSALPRQWKIGSCSSERKLCMSVWACQIQGPTEFVGEAPSAKRGPTEMMMNLRVAPCQRPIIPY